MTPPTEHPGPEARTLREAYRVLASGGLVARLLELARDEDLGPGGIDATSLAIGTRAGEPVEASVVLREAGVVSGLSSVPDLLAVFMEGQRPVEFESRAADGEACNPGAVLGVLRGSRGDVVRVERTLLNLVGRLSGVATRTATFVRAMGEGGRAALYDTRKTTPGLRVLEKYAVLCGGGRSHRLGLHDAVLIKDNHIAGIPAAELGDAVAYLARRARAASPAFVEIEVDTLDQLAAVLEVEPGLVDIVLLDNMAPPALARAVEMRDAARSRVLLEASGGVTLETIGPIAATGVDRVSVGSLTHHAVSLDVGLDIGAGADQA